MSNLVKNELIKIFSQKKLYVFLVIILVWVSLTTIISYIGIINNKANGHSLAYDNLALMIDFLYPILSIVLIAEMVTEELTKGTFTLTLIHPVSRKKYLDAKLISAAMGILILMIFTIMVSYIVGLIVFGWGDSFTVSEYKLSPIQGFLLTLASYLISLVVLMSFNMLVFILALGLESSGAVVGAATGIYFALNVIRLFISGLRPYIIHSYFRLYDIVIAGGQGSALFGGILAILVYGISGYLTLLWMIKHKSFA